MNSNFGIGGNEVKGDAYEAITEIPKNRTLIACKLTPDTPIKPVIVEGLKTIEDVFEHFSPELKMEFEDREGGVIHENLKFRNLGDFGKKGLTNNSAFLKNLEIESEQYRKIIKQLKTNKILKKALQDSEARQSILETIDTLIDELKNTQL